MAPIVASRWPRGVRSKAPGGWRSSPRHPTSRGLSSGRGAGWSNGRWEGETLVVDTKGFNDLSWFDRAGNFHSDALHVVERFTPRSAETITYEVTIEDPKVFSRPWKMSMPLYKHVERNAQILEFRCVEFVEDLLYGHLRKQPAAK